VLHVLDFSISWDFTSFEEHTSSKCGGILAGELSVWKACAIELVEKVPPGATSVNTVARTLRFDPHCTQVLVIITTLAKVSPHWPCCLLDDILWHSLAWALARKPSLEHIQFIIKGKVTNVSPSLIRLWRGLHS
jgi:hypothetical protein